MYLVPFVSLANYSRTAATTASNGYDWKIESSGALITRILTHTLWKSKPDATERLPRPAAALNMYVGYFTGKKDAVSTFKTERTTVHVRRRQRVEWFQNDWPKVRRKQLFSTPRTSTSESKAPAIWTSVNLFHTSICLNNKENTLHQSSTVAAKSPTTPSELKYI